jgi:DMSO/TMAO reductase YedYZ molybdopterin-dependent catalytic subunit
MVTSWTDEASLGGIDRRSFLRGTTAAAVAMGCGSPFLRSLRGEEPAPAGLIVRQKDPDNLEFPFASLRSFLTPNELFYVRNHYSVPSIDLNTWRLRIVGAVARPLELTYDQLQAIPAVTEAFTLECAGNGRAYLSPKAKGVPWELGAISTATWTGVPLAALLERAGVAPGAVEVILEGADRGEPVGEMKPPGKLSFARSLPLAKALRPEVMLAHRMNGAALPPAHGFPLRAVVGGWYGMASIKWLERIVVTDRPFLGYEQSADYTIWQRRAGIPSLTPIGEVEVKASIARPSAGEVVPAGAAYRVHGAAWTGESDVANVDVSTDGGKNWQPARLLGDPVPFAWRLWEYSWRPAAGGKHTLMARATDRRGRIQPLERDPDRRNYLISHVQPVEVEARG